MKFTRFIYKSNVCDGVVSNEGIKEIKGDMFTDWEYTGNIYSLNEVEWLAPITPEKIIGIGANYVSSKDNLPDELPEIPVFFFKPSSSIAHHDQEVVIPEGIDEVKFESELAVVIGKEAKEISEDDVLDYVFGYTVANDITAPQFFREDGHWTIGKSFDTFTPLGPVIETELDPAQVTVKADLNGEEKQNSKTDLMIVPLKKMISYLSSVMTLSPGDVILTGSPIGAELIGDGDIIECKIDDIGILRNRTVKTKKKVNV